MCTLFVGSSLALAGTFPSNKYVPSVTDTSQALSFSKRHYKHLAFRIASEPLIGEAKPHLPQLTQIDEGHLPLPIVPSAAEVPDPKAGRQIAGRIALMLLWNRCLFPRILISGTIALPRYQETPLDSTIIPR